MNYSIEILELLNRYNVAVYDCSWNLVKKLDNKIYNLTGKLARDINKELDK